MAGRLDGTRILILETREEAQFSRLLADQGAEVLQCPMVAIVDAPDPAPVAAWIDRLIAAPFDDLVLTTGEGLRRLTRLARSLDRERDFVDAIGKTRRFARGPKPGRALREIGLDADVTTETPTSEGIAATLAKSDLRDHRVGLQLYPDKDHAALIGAVEAQGAVVDAVLPYAYDARAAEENVVTAIEEMAQGRVDAIALTSSNQLRRLFDVATARGYEARLREGLDATPIASVGPVVSDELRHYGLTPAITPPEGAFFMKPLISAMITSLNRRASRTAPSS
ncbi:Uroporphyrinogen III synthase HEM4 [Rhodopseudomonas palustris HaA2]|uniref:Uroporphyrinogen III synthase HEM4 n=1 Tax=Rhodopseudomonas palustris (strain HaA2) TaxID=316058 RepID=Q2IZS4_RHOP2|nr:uroporphyrinogen-III synthase [Rhodopseudomonas palustris]ABD06286.1 Uroporphyrinogen III synthase HEM4 [Rhodopseudomonas palustris HaA2]